MARPSTTQLSAKHWKALELIEEGTLSHKEIAKTLGWHEKTLQQLMAGNLKQMGTTGELFYAELRKIYVRNIAKVKQIHKENQLIALHALNDRLKELKAKKPNKVITAEICKIMTAVGKAQPNIEINNQTLNYTKGYSAEELVYEFHRLGSIARSALIGRGVQGSEQGGSGSVPAPDGEGSRISEES